MAERDRFRNDERWSRDDDWRREGGSYRSGSEARRGFGEGNEDYYRSRDFGSRGEFGRGMKPEPPDLAHTAREMKLREVFWVVHHGIRHTGMPAFGATHSQDDLWAIATFVERFDEMTSAEFQQWIEKAGGDSASHSH